MPLTVLYYPLLYYPVLDLQLGVLHTAAGRGLPDGTLQQVVPNMT